MDLTSEEQTLLSHFRRLAPESRRELLDLASVMASREPEALLAERQDMQCVLERRVKDRLETASEPIFTE
ncbi:hypothetical protein [Geobacter sp. DSM 9736]|uniref:hypothetical protein n=1 Tax=Geobacter sp. DSM 9736 TaxID=1277350 RepID=UPI000B510051|nr:hypothetical protein [Geobacter sp. DSM 9736]SNB47690.1 hypothetical protein SAMN06269301_3182 [Geobacter sp. DSM 9736]